MTRRRHTAALSAAGALLLLAGCSSDGATPADDVDPRDTMESSTVSTETDDTTGPVEPTPSD